MGAHETIDVVVEDGIATLTLQRPKRLNAFSATMGAEVFGTIGERVRISTIVARR